MREQKKIFEVKEQSKTSEEELYKVEMSNLPNKEVEVISIKMLNKLGRKRINTVGNLTKS